MTQLNSVTKFFYDRGWHGINIEPLPNMYALLVENRPRDIKLCVGLAGERGNLPLHVTLNGLGMTTFLEDWAEGFRKSSKFENPYPQISRRILTLTDIYERFCKIQPEIHFCKIDVEGYEGEVLKGVSDWNKFRPWIFLLEAFNGNHSPWEHILTTNGYVYAFETKHNRYYVDMEKEYLMQGFQKINQFISQNEIFKMFMQKMTFK